MSYSTTNAHVLFPEIIDAIFQDMELCIQYRDDLLIYAGNTEAEHQAIVEKLLQQCIKHGLGVNLLKLEFHMHETLFLCHVIHSQEVTMDPCKFEIMSQWPIPRQKKQVQGFLGCANYYCEFIMHYSTKTHSLLHLTNDVLFA